MAIKFANNASSTLASSITNSATTITLSAGGGGLFPALGASDYFYATLADSSNNLEIVKCTARSGDTLTVVRGQEGTTARAYVAGDKLELRPTAATLADIASGTNISALPVTQGGTGSSTASGARANLGTVADTATNGIAVRTGANTLTPRSVTAGTGISVTNGDGVAGDVVVANAGVTSLIAGTGISISSATGDATITNTGVTSVNGSTGDVTTGGYILRAYTSPAVWNRPSNLRAVKFTVVGGGGPGGTGIPTNGASGGGGGGASIGYLSGNSIPAMAPSYTVTAGPGTNSVGALISATGGSTGINAGPGTGNIRTVPGGSGSGGNININGAPSMVSWQATNGNYGGIGGNSLMGSGGQGTMQVTAPFNAAQPGRGYGGGGGGGAAPSAAGGVGAPGIVIIEEFY